MESAVCKGILSEHRTGKWTEINTTSWKMTRTNFAFMTKIDKIALSFVQAATCTKNWKILRLEKNQTWLCYSMKASSLCWWNHFYAELSVALFSFPTDGWNETIFKWKIHAILFIIFWCDLINQTFWMIWRQPKNWMNRRLWTDPS